MSRTDRYQSIIGDTLEQPIAIYGLGAIGRQVALMLATMGATCLHLYEFDTVEEHNMGTQGYRPDQIGQTKLDATTEDIEAINPECVIHTHQRDSYDCEIAFLCVDQLDVRERIATEIWDHHKGRIIDTRMGGQTAVILFSEVDSSQSLRAYMDTIPLNPVEERCTARSTLYAASTAASLAVAGYINDLCWGQTRSMSLFDLSMTPASLQEFAALVNPPVVQEDPDEPSSETAEQPSEDCQQPVGQTVP